MRSLHFPQSFSKWRTIARNLLLEGIHPHQVEWVSRSENLLDFDLPTPTNHYRAQSTEQTFKISKAFLELAETVACYRSDDKWSSLYHVLWKLVHENKKLLEIGLDKDLLRCNQMTKAIHRDCHKMKAFVRFREVARDQQGTEPHYVAWFEPMHLITERMAPFFQKRFSNMNWSILTPDSCLHWYNKKLTVTKGLSKKWNATDDQFEELWLTYYKNIYNPARLKEKAMTNEMPQKYWKNLPEAELIPTLTEKGKRQDIQRDWDVCRTVK